MFFYAEINEQNICIGIKAGPSEMHFDNHLPIESMNFDYMWKKYENGHWSEEQFLPDAGAIQLSRMEQLEKRNVELEKSQADQDELLMQLMLSTGGN